MFLFKRKCIFVYVLILFVNIYFCASIITLCLFYFFAVHSLPHLTVLSLSGCSKITDDGVELIAENLQKLRALDLSWCPRITDAALEYIACDLNMLEELTLDRYAHLYDTWNRTNQYLYKNEFFSTVHFFLLPFVALILSLCVFELYGVS